MRFLLIVLILSFSGSVLNAQQSAENDIVAGTVIVKLKYAFANKCNKSSIAIPEFEALLENATVQESKKLFPNHPTLLKTKSNKSHVDLSTIYRLKFDANQNPFKIIRQLKNSDYVEYAEPEYINQLAYAPADSLNNQQS